MFSSDYDPDEALWITEVSVLLEGQRYKFNVRNSGGQFMLMIVQHMMRGTLPHEIVLCRHCGEDNGIFEPCTAVSRDIKEAARRSIAEHNAKYHFMKKIK